MDCEALFRDPPEEMDFEGEPSPEDVLACLEYWDVHVTRHASAQLNRAIWQAFGFPYFLALNLPDRDVCPVAARITLSIPVCHGRGVPMENGFFMLWHIVAKAYPQSVVVLEALTQLVGHADPRVQFAALHGLGHLEHPARLAAIQGWLARFPEAKDDPWVQQVLHGSVM